MIKQLLLTTALAAGTVASINALPTLTGDIEFGSFSPASLTGGAGLDTATGIDFNNIPFVGSAIVNSGATDDFAGLPGLTAEFFDFTFNPLPGTGADIWNIPAAGILFHLDSVTIDQQDANGLVLLGSGIVTAPGFDPTPMAFAFSMQGADGDQTFSFSAGGTAPIPDIPNTSVPDGGTSAALLGLGVASLVTFSSRKRAGC